MAAGSHHDNFTTEIIILDTINNPQNTKTQNISESHPTIRYKVA